MKLYNKKIIIGLAILTMFTISCGKKKKAEVVNTRPVKVQVIGQNSISLGYTASGTLKGIEEVPYTATSSGEIVVINAKNGDSVNAGQVIVSIDNQAARSNVRSAASNVNTASSNINSAAAALEEARINYEKYSMLYNKRLVTETDYLKAKTNYNAARVYDTYIILDTNITKELQEEGIAREMISKIQNIRKTQDFNVTDRIVVNYNTDEVLVKEAINTFKDLIQRETLCDELNLSNYKENSYDINGYDVYIKVLKK